MKLNIWDKLKKTKDYLSPTVLKKKFKSSLHNWSKKKTVITILSTIVLFFLIGGLAILNLTAPPGDGNQVIHVEVPLGTSTQEIAQMLKKEGVIKNKNLFLAYAHLNNLNGSFQAGDYTLTDGLSYEELGELLTEGRVARETVRFTIPEGFTVEQIAIRLEEQGLAERDKFLQLVQDGEFEYDFIERLEDVQHDYRLEGYLFPNTYEVYPDITEWQLIDMMLSSFDEVLTESKIDQMEELDLTVHEAVTLASLIEREAKHDSEKTKIASVIYNRLEKGMLLQIDATVLYAIGHRERVTYEDLEVDSPYNTYKYKGIPPTPIASPGKASIDAVLQPKDTNYLYYVADRETGYHHFAQTYEEHQENADRYWHTD
ncbi:endolytic transglycosylase MltG [Proteinivorax tanatarense]|uniref:Endolytic murein transglycosylase n=1 Tax=Proteinivorax tanatarense TaxID=1260629 RepID=A0AAU7VPB3_9FIRM